MQGTYRCRLSVMGITGVMIMLASLAVASAEPGGERGPATLAVVDNPVGLTMDFWANAYTVDRNTGKVFCLPAGSEPVHYATVEGEATTLPVDRERTLFVGTTSGHVLAVKRDGSVFEAYRCPGSVAGLTVDRDGGLLIATDRGTITRLRRSELVVNRRD